MFVWLINRNKYFRLKKSFTYAILTTQFKKNIDIYIKKYLLIIGQFSELDQLPDHILIENCFYS